MGTSRAGYGWRFWAGATVVAILIVGAIAFPVVGRQHAEQACALDTSVPIGADGSSWTTSWSWAPPGFACTWPSEDGADDITVSQLWW